MRIFKNTQSNTREAATFRVLSPGELAAVAGGTPIVVHRPPPPAPPVGFLTSLPGYASVGTPLKPTHQPLPM